MIDVSLANLTLQKIGADDQLVDPDESSHNARTVRASWDHVRQVCLRELTPTFAKRRAALPAREVTALRPVIGFSNAFPVPAGFLRLLEVLSPASARSAYRLLGDDESAGGAEILADTAGPIEVEIVVDVTDPVRWDPLFRESFADRLGMQIADRITCDLNRVERCARDWKAARIAAGGADSKEQPPIEHEDSSWITARFGGDGGWGERPPNV